MVVGAISGYILFVAVWDHWLGASVACWLVSRGHWDSEGYFSWGFSVCRLGSQYTLSVREDFLPGRFRQI
jgi:hypothetical protein